MNSFTPKLVSVLRMGYQPANLRADAIAGLTVAIVALPLALALGIASGASPDKGLVTAVVAGFVISALGGSRVQIGGPTGAFVVVVFTVIAEHGYDGLLLATMLAGLILVAAGYARLGQIIRFIPYPVVTGFTAGIAVIIATSQIADLLGLQIEAPPADFIPRWLSYAANIHTINKVALTIGTLCLVTIVALRRYVPKAPGYLVAVVGATVFAQVFDLRIDTVGTRFSDLPHGLPVPSIPDVSFHKVREVLPSSLTIAFLAGIEALLSAMVADGMTGFRHRSNQELVAQGLANMASAAFGALPATGAIARTATNIRAGGRTPVAGILHAVFILVFMLLAGNLISAVPMAALAAVLLMVAWGMSEYEKFIGLMKLSADDRALLLLTFFLTILVDLTIAIAVGVVLASLIFLHRMSKTAVIMTPQEDDDDDAKHLQEQRGGLPAGVEVFRISGPLFFGVASQLLDSLGRMGQSPRVLILRLKEMPFLDASGVRALDDLASECIRRSIRLVFSDVQDQPLSLLARAGLGVGGAKAVHASDYAAALELAKHLQSR